MTSTSVAAKDCLESAGRARQMADQADDTKARDHWLELEQRWLRMAELCASDDHARVFAKGDLTVDGPATYRVRESEGAWIWDVRSADGELLHQGTASSQSDATTQALSAGLDHSVVDRDVVRRQTLLFVDDDETFTYAASRFFEKLGYETIVAGGSMEAFRKIEGRSVDLLVTDVRLKEMEPHGIALGRILRNRRPGFPVLVVTAFPDVLEREKPLPGRAFVKPVDFAVLADEVKRSLAP